MFQYPEAKNVAIVLVGDLKNKVGTLVHDLSPVNNFLCFRNGGQAGNSLKKKGSKRKEEVGIIICEQNLPDIKGTDFLEHSISMYPLAKRILLIDYTQLDMEAIRRAQLFRFITKPYALESLISTINAAIGEVKEKQQPLLRDQEIVGQDPAFMKVLNLVRRVSDSRFPVLVQGETGTGKELIARALHDNGPGKGKPYIAVNCSAIAETLFEAEMFGHKKGAFTNAYQDRKGIVAQADGGTLFLDEVADIPLQVQTKLLRFLQFKEFQPVGSDHVKTANVRIVAATNRDLEKKIAEGSFRKDLYYRLKVIDVALPPLRERRCDISILIDSFVKKYWSSTGKPELTGQLLRVLQAYDYPGNVRELENLMQRACLLAHTNEIDLDVLPPELIKKARARENVEPVVFSHSNEMFRHLDKEELKKSRTQAADRVEREFLTQLISRFKTVSSAAGHAGLQRTYLHKLLVKHGLCN